MVGGTITGGFDGGIFVGGLVGTDGGYFVVGGLDGTDGIDGTDGVDGTDGLDGTDGGDFFVGGVDVRDVNIDGTDGGDFFVGGFDTCVVVFVMDGVDVVFVVPFFEYLPKISPDSIFLGLRGEKKSCKLYSMLNGFWDVSLDISSDFAEYNGLAMRGLPDFDLVCIFLSIGVN